jgi:cellulose synthase/poly-beta-1,6-N-acetylglucosamine synthase-like glycosyltransferase
LTENLEPLFEQEYHEYEIVFVVDDENDLAVRSIEEVSRKAAKKTKLVVASKAIDSSQKVENLREAVLYANGRSRVFVFVDSDARPSKRWLRSLVAPLENESVGAATGYRWFISPKPTFASELRNIWNASIASQLGPNTDGNFCWGGSMAIRRDTFETLDIRERWRGTVSDDFVVRTVMNEAGLAIHFVPQALTASVGGCSFREMIEFTTRQMKLTRVYARKFWLMSFFGSGLFSVVMLWSLGIVILSRENEPQVFAAISTVVLVSAFSICKSYLRLKAVRLILTQYTTELRRQNFPQSTLWAISPFVFFANCVAPMFSRRIRWRGITYEMVSATETRIKRDSI